MEATHDQTMAALMKRKSSEDTIATPIGLLPRNALLGRKRSKTTVSVVDALEVTLIRSEPNERAGIVLDEKYTDRAIVKSVLDGSPAGATQASHLPTMRIRPRDEIFAIDGVPVTSAKHMVELMRQSNKLKVVVTKTRVTVP